jgi:glycosyltransferase involved in cell wall biosynthesis
MRIVLDLQACQCVSRYRGIGRYSLAFAEAVIRNAPEHEVFILLNGMFEEATADLTRHFQTMVPPGQILTWRTEGPTAESDPTNRERRERAEDSREEFIASLAPDIVHIGSLFEGFPDSAITSIGAYSGGPPTSATIYDLIPLVYREIYLDSQSEHLRNYYLRKLSYVGRATPALAISEATRRDVIERLQMDPDSVINISTAADPLFRPVAAETYNATDLLGKVGITRPFAMYLGGMDRRKNIVGLVKSWAQLPQHVRDSHQLAVVCEMPEGYRAWLRNIARECGMTPDELILPGFVSDYDLVRLYNLAKACVFPSWYEGFGLPVLEAMACGTAVVASNTSSLPEVVGRADALFDPLEESSIAASLGRVLTDDAFRTSLEAYGLQRARLFSWDITARRSLDAFERVAQQGERRRSLVSVTGR